MKLIILTMETDPSGYRFKKEAQAMGIDYEFHYYSQLQPFSTPLPPLVTDKETVILARRPYASNDLYLHYFSLLRVIRERFTYKRMSDEALYDADYLARSDKLWIQDCFERLKLPVAPLFDWRQIQEDSFPIIAKKRLSARSRANYLLRDQEDLERFGAMYPAADFIFQKFFPLKGDYRVVVMGDEILGVVKRKVIIKPDNRVVVKVTGKAFLPKKVLNGCIKIAKAVGADLLGVDVGKKENGEYFFIEYNYSPQFLGFERESGINLARAYIEYLMR